MRTSINNVTLTTVLLLMVFSLYCVSCNKEDKRRISTPAAVPVDSPPPSLPGIVVSWEVLENFYEKRPAFKSQFKITNNTNVPLDNSNWTYYFNFSRVIESASVPRTVRMTQINGDFYKMEPSTKFPVLKKGDSITISFVSGNWAINESDAPAGGYFVFTDDEGAQLRPNFFGPVLVKPFVTEKQTRRNAIDNLPVSSPQLRYQRNRTMLGKTPAQVNNKIIPTPLEVQQKKGHLILDTNFEIHCAVELKEEAALLNKAIEKILGKPLTLVHNSKPSANAILLKLDHQPGDATGRQPGHQEAYRLTIDARTGIGITGAAEPGIFYGIRSLQALLPIAVDRKPLSRIKLQALEIKDAPRFAYRGMHLDVARNFHDKESVKRLLEVMSFYKLNKLHFHLTDDEGWRLEIRELPELTQIGGLRGHTLDESKCLYPSFGSGPFKDASRSHGSGYYTRADFIEILEYAHLHHIEVIPEIDVPGHARAAIKAMDVRYRRLMRQGKKEDAEQFLLRDLEDKSTYRSVQYWTDNTLCVGRESVYRFLETVVDDLRAMYREAGAPLTTIHTGGDEVPHGVWEKSPICQKLIKDNKSISRTKELSRYFLQRFNKILRDRNLVTGGWQEIALKHSSQAGLVPAGELVDKQVLPYVWDNVWGWGKEDVGNRLANAGFPVVIAYVTNLYFDLAYQKDPAEPGYYWGGFIDTRKAFELTPLDIRKCADTDLLGNLLDREKFFKKVQPLTPEGAANIKGIQGLLWGENTKGRDMLEYLAFPKLLGLAERAWAPQPEWAQIVEDGARKKELNRNWSQFAHLLGNRELPRMDQWLGGLKYRVPLPGAIIENGKLLANVAFPGLTIRYTLDGKEPAADSLVYQAPVQLTKEITVIKLITVTSNGRFSRTSILKAL